MDCVPNISVVMPVFNGARLLRRMMDSILAQTHKNFELICVDDGSTDSSLSILDEYRSQDPRIIVIKQANMGGRLARANGMSVARGKYVYFCDQDDFVHPQLLEFCFRTCERNSLDFLSFYGQVFSLDGNPAVTQVDMNDDSGLAVVVKGMEMDRQNVARQALKSVNIDYWGQFARRETVNGLPFDYTRTFRILLLSDRWAWSPNIQTYWYFKSAKPSWSKQPMSTELIVRGAQERSMLCDLFAGVRAAGDPWGMWRIIQRHFLLKNLKMDLNALVQRNPYHDATHRIEARKAFAAGLWELYDKHCVHIADIKMRHLMKYILLMLRYGRKKKEG